MKALKSIAAAMLICTFASRKIGTSLCSAFALLLICISAHLPIRTFANNVNITNTSVSGSYIRFRITWENSWRVTAPPYNWDAVWVFVKYAQCGGTTQVWQHANLSPNASDDSCDVKLQVIPSLQANDSCQGVYIVRNPNNTGGPGDANIPANASTPANSLVRLTMNIPSGTYNFKVFGVEMVYVPSNNFQVGDGASVSTFSSVTVTSSHETVDNALTGAALGGGSSNIPAAYPVGWQSFYCMKYEISQEEYVDFLNTLTYDQQASRTNAATPPNSPQLTHALTGVAAGGAILNRNGIMILAQGNAGTTPKTPAIYGCGLNAGGLGASTLNQADDGQNVACNYMNWADLVAYLDWACLRPMSEMEYEKVCRGINARVAAERPWGTGAPIFQWRYCCPLAWSNTGTNGAGGGDPGLTSIINATSAALTAGTSGYNNETSTSVGAGNYGLCAIGNTGNTSTDGPLRVGFAATGSTNKITAGSGYYGVMDLAGNVWERTVSTDATGITFYQDSLGNGVLATDGNADVGTWPAPATAAGTGYRGGAWNTLYNSISCTPAGGCTCIWTNCAYNFALATTSNRSYATTADASRTSSFGGRGVRKGKGANN